MESWLTAFATSTTLVAVAEIGDKTQLLSFALAARYRKRGTIIHNEAEVGGIGDWKEIHAPANLAELNLESR